MTAGHFNARCKSDTLGDDETSCFSRLSTLDSRLPLGTLRSLATPIAWDLEDFSPWDKFLWTWRITGICAECHVFTYLRDHLRRWKSSPPTK